MARFWGGFAVACVLWGAGAAYLHLGLGYGPPPEVEVAAAEPEVPDVEAEPEEPARARRRRRRRRRGAARAGRGTTPTGTATTGDDLGEDDVRTIDMNGSGGEQQLRGSQIDAGFDTAMGGIRRCLFLIPGDADVRGRVVFGMRIAGNGRVQRVNLSGPRAATTGEAGACLRRTARAIQFDTFDGPEMLVRYPFTLE